MAVRVPEPDPAEVDDRRPAAEPSVATALVLALLLFAVLLANGRPSLGGPPALSPAVRALLPADDGAAALAGKVVASLLSCLAGAALFLAVGRRFSESEAATAAAILVLGTPVWAASQALWPQPVSVFFVSVAVLFIARAEDDPVWAGRAGLPLGLAVAVNLADAALAGVLAAAIVVRWPRRAAVLAGFAAAPVLAGLAVRGLTASSSLGAALAARYAEPFGPGQFALLASPGKGVLVFAPVVLVAMAGLVLAYRYGERWQAVSAGAAVLAHALLAGSAGDWFAGDAWGPRPLADAMPLLVLFLPDGFTLTSALGRAAAAASVAIGALGAFAYDNRWTQLVQRPPAPDHAEMWDAAHSPVVLYARRRVVTLAAPGLAEGRVVFRAHPFVLFGPEGSRVEFAGEDPVITGAQATLGDVHLLGGARVDVRRLALRRVEDGLFLRVADGARGRTLELRIAGRGRGAIQVGEGGFWNPSPRWRSHPVSGEFLVRHPYRYPESGGPDLRVLPTAGSEVDLAWITLVPPTEPLTVIRTPQ